MLSFEDKILIKIWENQRDFLPEKTRQGIP